MDSMMFIAIIGILGILVVLLLITTKLRDMETKIDAILRKK